MNAVSVEVFSSQLASANTKALYHFENNLTNNGNTSYYFYDGQYTYSEDAKFGSYSVNHYRYNMTFSTAYNTYLHLFVPATLEIWFKPTITNYNFSMGICNTDWVSKLAVAMGHAGNAIWADTADSELFAVSGIVLNTWNHIALTCETIADVGTKLVVWVNGIKRAEKIGTTPANSGRFYFNTVGDDNSSATGLCDEFVYHNYVRYTRNFALQTEAYSIV